MDKESMEIFLKIQGEQINNKFFLSLSEEQKRIYNQIHVLHLAKLFNFNGKIDEAKRVLKEYNELYQESSDTSSSSTGEVFLFIRKFNGGYACGTAVVIATDVEEADRIFMDSVQDYVYNRYVGFAWEKNFVIGSIKPCFVCENSYVE